MEFRLNIIMWVKMPQNNETSNKNETKTFEIQSENETSRNRILFIILLLSLVHGSGTLYIGKIVPVLSAMK